MNPSTIVFWLLAWAALSAIAVPVLRTGGLFCQFGWHTWVWRQDRVLPGFHVECRYCCAWPEHPERFGGRPGDG